jgi:hypothetical protein
MKTGRCLFSEANLTASLVGREIDASRTDCSHVRGCSFRFKLPVRGATMRRRRLRTRRLYVREFQAASRHFTRIDLALVLLSYDPNAHFRAHACAVCRRASRESGTSKSAAPRDGVRNPPTPPKERRRSSLVASQQTNVTVARQPPGKNRPTRSLPPHLW